MDVRQLQALVAVSEHRTFSAAADALNTVQSNISAHVARLERELGATLVDRAAGRLTEEGEAVVARARRVFYELEAAVADVSALGAEVTGTVQLGMIGTVGRWLVPRMFAELGARHPGIRLVVVEGSSAALETRLAAGGLDLSLANLPLPSHDLTTEPIFDEDLVLVVPATDAWAERSEISLAELAERPLLLPLPGTAFRDDIDAAARAAGVALQVKAELDGVRLIASLTFEGTGPSVLPASATPSFLRDTWRSIAVRGLPPRRIGVATRRRGLLSAPAKAVAAVLRDVVAAVAGPDSGIHLHTPAVAH